MKTILEQCPIIAILRNLPPELLIPYAESILKSGICVFEVAMNTPDGSSQIATLKQWFGDNITVGAGTAITRERIDMAALAGAEFFLTPSTEEEQLRYCRQNQMRLLPGVMTPTDVALCLKYGFHIMKLFPAGDLPPAYIKSLKGPFNDTDYVAVGGVHAGNLQTFFDSGFIGAGIGSSLIPSAYISNQDWAGAAAYVGEHYGKYLDFSGIVPLQEKTDIF